MITVEVKTAKPYNVYIESGLLGKIDDYLGTTKRRIMIVTDDTVNDLYSENVYEKLQSKHYNVYKFVFKHGEDSKNKETLFNILEELSRLNFDRSDMLIAIGGGVVGDITGFAAGIYMRGIKYIQIPTTLLSAIDSSVGGKTAINLGAVKNQIGVFNQPEFVLIDTAAIKTCPCEIFIDGMGEGIKYAILCGGRVAEIVKNKAVLQNFDEFVSLCVAYKADIVSQDEKENGLRRLLNLGHTVGHAIEALSEHRISHGNAVVYGIKILCGALAFDNRINRELFNEINAVISVYFKLKVLNYEAKDIINLIKNDKKVAGGKVKIVYPIRVGEVIQTEFSFDELNYLLDKYLEHCEKEVVE